MVFKSFIFVTPIAKLRQQAVNLKYIMLVITCPREKTVTGFTLIKKAAVPEKAKVFMRSFLLKS